MKSPEEIAAYRLSRLEAAKTRFGSQLALGKALGHYDGSAVGQMLRGEKPITEKTIHTIESLDGMAGWFDIPIEEAHWPFRTPYADYEAMQPLDKTKLDNLVATFIADTIPAKSRTKTRVA